MPLQLLRNKKNTTTICHIGYMPLEISKIETMHSHPFFHLRSRPHPLPPSSSPFPTSSPSPASGRAWGGIAPSLSLSVVNTISSFPPLHIPLAGELPPHAHKHSHRRLRRSPWLHPAGWWWGARARYTWTPARGQRTRLRGTRSLRMGKRAGKTTMQGRRGGGRRWTGWAARPRGCGSRGRGRRPRGRSGGLAWRGASSPGRALTRRRRQRRKLGSGARGGGSGGGVGARAPPPPSVSSIQSVAVAAVLDAIWSSGAVTAVLDPQREVSTDAAAAVLDTICGGSAQEPLPPSSPLSSLPSQGWRKRWGRKRREMETVKPGGTKRRERGDGKSDGSDMVLILENSSGM